MKYTINQVEKGENEVILNYSRRDAEVERVIAFLKQDERRIIGYLEKKQVVIKPENILYIESVDGRTFAYTEGAVYKLTCNLSQMEGLLTDVNFYRCSKSMIMNIDCVVNLRSLSSNRIDAVMKNGEHIIISRTYASGFRKRLRGEM